MGPRVQLPPEIQLAQRLAGNEQVTRDRAVRKLRKYIVARTQRAEGWRGVDGMWAGGVSRTGPGWGLEGPGWGPAARVSRLSNRVEPPRGPAGRAEPGRAVAMLPPTPPVTLPPERLALIPYPR